MNSEIETRGEPEGEPGSGLTLTTDPNCKKPRHENKPSLKITGKTKLEHTNTSIDKTTHNIKPEKNITKTDGKEKIKSHRKKTP